MNIYHIEKSSTRKINWTNGQIKHIKKLYTKDKLSVPKIAELFNVSNPVIRKILLDNNVSIRSVGNESRKFSDDDNFFEVIDSEEKAYWLGFLYADGYVTTTNKLRINLSIDDESHIKKFYKSIKSNRTVKYSIKRDNGKVYHQAYANVESSKLVKHLINKGCTNNKSLTLTFPSEDIVSKHLVLHFIRGYFDGDGSIHVPKINNTGHKNYRISFLGTLEFLTELQKILGVQHIKLEDKKRTTV